MPSLDLWKSFVDTFASLHDGVHHKWILENGAYPRVSENEKINEFLSSLSVENRGILASMMVDARRGGVHDALAVLNDRMAIENAKYSENGVEMEFQPFGTSLYYDYVCRREGDEWPEE